MLSRILLFVLCICTVSACTISRGLEAPAEPRSHVNQASDLRARTVAVVSLDEDGDLSSICSGVWIAPSAYVTARHCVKEPLGATRFYLTFEDMFPNGAGTAESENYSRRASALVAFDELHDLAIMKAPGAPAHPLAALHVGAVRQGELAQTMGHPLGLWWSYSSGDVASVRAFDEERGQLIVVQSTSPISPGNSGGGLFDEDGALMGIAHVYVPGGQALNVFIHVQYVSALIEAARKAGAL